MLQTQLLQPYQSTSSLFLKSTPTNDPDRSLTFAPTSRFSLTPEELVDVVLRLLQVGGVRVIEWGTPLYRRMGVPRILMHYSYLIPDDELEYASLIVSQFGLPPSPFHELLLDTQGDLHRKSYLHRLTAATELGAVQYLMLYPLSLAAFRRSELSLLPRITPLSSPHCKQVLVPHPPAVFAAFVRMMQAYPRFAPTRTVLEADLSELIGYHLYGMEDGYIDVDDDELCEELAVDERVEQAVKTVLSWKCSSEWRAGEEWICDALATVVEGTGDIGFLPWGPS